MAGEREFSVILKAADLSSQPIQQVVDTLKKLTAAQIAVNESAKAGAVSSKDFKDSLANLLAAAKAVSDQQTSLQRFIDLQKNYERAVEAVAAVETRRAGVIAGLPDEESRTARQVSALARVEKALESAQKKADTSRASLAAYQATLDKMGVQPEADRQLVALQRDQERALNAVIAAREKLNAKIAAAPPEEERTKAQAYAVSRLERALLNAESRAEAAKVAFEKYASVKMNEAVLREQERLGQILTEIVPVVSRANQETLALAENREKAAAAAKEQSAAEKALADQLREQAAAEERANADFAARNRAQREAADQSKFGAPNKTGQLRGGEVDKSIVAAEEANQLSLRRVRQSAFEEALRENEREVAAARAAEKALADQLREQAVAEERANADFAARNRAQREADQSRFGAPNKTGQLRSGEVDKSIVAAEEANQLSLRRVRQSAFEEALRENEREVAAARAASEAIQALNKRAESEARDAARQAAENARRAESQEKASADTAIELARYVGQEKRKAAQDTAKEQSDADADFVARNRAQREADQSKFGVPDKTGQLRGGEVDKAIAAAAEANQLSLRRVRQSAFEEALRENEREVAAARTVFEAIQAFNKRAESEARDAARQAGENARRAESQEKASADTTVALARYIGQEKRKAAQDAFDAAEELRRRQEDADKKQADRVEALRTAQGKIADAQAALPATQPLGVSATPAQDFLSLSSALTSVLNPAQAARQTLAGLEAEVTSLGQLLTGMKQRSEDYQAAQRKLALTFTELQRAASLVDTYRANEAASKRFADALTREQIKLEGMVELYNRQNTADKESEARIQAQISKVDAAARAFNAWNEKLAETTDQLKSLGVNTADIESAFARITAAGTKGKEVFDGLQQASGKGGGTGALFLGLRPYELQNLSYQINDVFTQLASGTSLSQTAAQQGGQIFQLFERDIGAAYQSLKLIPFGLAAAGAAAAAATVGILAFIRALDTASEKRAFAAELKQNVDGARYSIDDLVESAKGLEHLGVSLSDAAKGARDLITAGASRDKIRPLLELAANFANANNLKFPEALKQVQTAFTGTGADLLKFASQLNNLITADQFKRIDDLVKSGDIIAARAEAYEAVFPRIKDAADAATTPILKAFRELRAAWGELLDSLANNRVINSFGSALIAWLTTATNLTRDIFRFLDATVHLDFENMRRAFLGLPSVKPQEQGTSAPSATAQAASVPGQKPGETSEFVALRDQVADAVGVSREAFRILQQSEGVFDQKTQKWSDALDKAGNVIANGGKGPAQLVQSTFEDVKKRYPDLITGDVHDVKSNLMAGAIYFKEIAQQVGGDFRTALQGYKQGPGTVTGSQDQRDRAMAGISADRREQNRLSISQYGSAYANSVITRPGAPLAVGAVSPPSEKVTSATAADQTATNAQRIATQRFSESQQEILDSQRKAFADEAQQYDILVADRQRARDKVAKEAQKFAAENNTAMISDTELHKQQAEAEDVVNKQYHEAWLGRLREREQFANTVRERELAADKTNLGAQLELVNRRYDAEQTQRAQLAAKGNYGVPLENAQEDIEKARQEALSRTTVDVAKAITDSVVQERDRSLQVVQSQLQNAKPSDAARLYAEQARIVSDFLPKINDALRKSGAALDKLPGPETEAVRAQRAQNELVRQQAERPEVIRSGEQQASTLAASDLQGALKQRAAELALITDQVKIGGSAFSTALNAIVQLSQRTTPQIKQLVDVTNDSFRQIASNRYTSPQERAALETQIRENELAPAKAALDTQNAIMAALQDDKAKLDKLLEEYKQAVIDLDKKIRDARLSPTQAAAERARLDADFIPRIGAAGRTVQQDVTQARQAAGQLGLAPGFQQQLAAFGQQAATESNERTLTTASLQDRGQQFFGQARQAQQTVSDVQRTQQELLRLNAVTQVEAEEKVKQAFADGNAEIAKVAPQIQQIIEEMTRLGNTAGARKLAEDFKLLQANMRYVDPLARLITTTFEQSFANRGGQLFDRIAQSIGNVIANGGKLKDVFREAGQAFAQFTAGILQDIAKQIIQYELLKIVRSALGLIGGAGDAVNSAGQSAGEVAFVGAAGAVPVSHSGGMVGDPTGASRVVDLSLFREARRMHTGGMVGLAPDEVPAILQRGEQVLSKAQVQRQADGYKSADSGGTSIRNVLAVGDKEIANAMNSGHGEKVVLNILQRNAPTVKKLVG